MEFHPTSDTRIKPRILIADDSRIVRATLIKHIQGLFEFREALDGEQAWEALLIDPAIRVVVTDLTMPRLDGYGLLQRIRGSQISRIRDIPVIVISGSDEQEERDRAKAAGATELITKGIATAQLLSRLDALSQLINDQAESGSGEGASLRHVRPAPALRFAAAEAMLAHAVRDDKNFVLLTVCVEIRHAQGSSNAASQPEPMARAMHAVDQLLQRAVRQTDCVARTADGEFSLATTGIDANSARAFAQRICNAIRQAKSLADEDLTLVASCGVACLAEDGGSGLQLGDLHAIAQRRAKLARSSSE
ncbi:MAG TPA: response regulator [Burkholderiaceae bacterium]|nr:response regulator [Burkholderiaceae bacterium]